MYIYKQIAIFLILISTDILSKDINIINKDFDYNSFCLSLQKQPKYSNKLDAYEKGELKYRYLEKKRSIINSYYLIKVSSDGYKLKDYDFEKQKYYIDNIKIPGKKVFFTLNDPLEIKVPKFIAHSVAIRKKLHMMDLYIIVKFEPISEISDSYCSYNEYDDIILAPKIYEYAFVCKESLKVLYHNINFNIKKIDKNYIDQPLIEGIDEKYRSEIEDDLLKINYDIAKCASYNEYGMKLYHLQINKKGEILKYKGDSNSFSKKVELCLDKIILNRDYLNNTGKKYNIYFSVILSNLY